MSDFQKFINRKDHDPYENIRISRVENDKKRPEDPYTELPPPATRPLVFASLVSVLKKIFTTLFNKGHSHELLFNPEQLLESVATFKTLIEILIEEDQSHNLAFTHQLSQVWHKLQDDCNSILAYSEQAPSYALKTKHFLNALSLYPESEEHSFGFYLTHFAGEDWTPFPFLEMLEHLHQECQTSPENATLVEWLIDLTEILSSC